MRLLGHRVRVVGLVLAVMLACGALVVVAGSSGAERSKAKPAAASKTALGNMTALAFEVQRPVGKRIVLRPHVSFKLERRALRLLRATKPRLSGSFTAKIVTVPARGKGRTLAEVSRNAKRVAVPISRSFLGERLALKKIVLSPKQTAAVKRAAERQVLALAISMRYRASYTNRHGRTVGTPLRSRSISLPLALHPLRARGANLHKLAASFRGLIGRVAQLKMACVDRNTLVGMLRSTYATMAGGNRTIAAELLRTSLSEVDLMRAGGLLGAQPAASLRSDLGTLIKRVGSGQSKRVEHARSWPAMPDCLKAPAAKTSRLRAHGSILWEMEVIHHVRKAHQRRKIGRTIRKHFDKWGRSVLISIGVSGTFGVGVGIGVGAINHVIWDPNKNKTGTAPPELGGTETDVVDLVPEGDPTGATSVLDDLRVQTDAFSKNAETFTMTNPSIVLSSWNSLMTNFPRDRWRFQPTSFYSLDDHIAVLPVFAEYMDLYLTTLREGVVNGPLFGLLPETVQDIEDKIRAELNPNSPSSDCSPTECAGGNAVSYLKRIYEAGLAKEGPSSDPQKDFLNTNDYKTTMQLEVLDARDAWYLQDPMAYPYGDPSYSKTRMIYSDAIGTTSSVFAPPSNVSFPLSALTAYTTRVTAGSYTNRNWLTAIQADNSPSVGARTGAAGGTPTAYSVAPGTTPGPIVQVDTTWEQNGSSAPQVIGTVQFHFADGTTVSAPGGDFYDRGDLSRAWSFEDEVLATAKIMGSYDLGGNAVGDSLVLGFRQADSFTSSWKGSHPGAFRAPNSQACLGVEQVPLTSGPHAGSTTGSRVSGAALQMRNCDTAAWDQIWKYVDYNDPNDPEDDPSQNDLDVYAGTQCAAPKDDVTSAGTPVVAYGCNGTTMQDWTKLAKTQAIVHSQSGLCLERAGAATSGTPLRLAACTGSDAQKWVWP